MTTNSATTRCLRTLLLPVVALGGGCSEPSQFLPSSQVGGPMGILDGTVTYSGPLPCTEAQHVVGAVALFAFDTTMLPPPEGLGTSPASFAAIGGDVLFGGVTDRLTYNGDGSRWCPPASTPEVTVSASWTLGPLPGGQYEVRGFYDLAGSFNPDFSITKLPVEGDVAGGAIDNVAAVLTGAAPVYRRITLGTLRADGTYLIPPQGSNIGGIAVTLALRLPLGLPIFYPSAVTYSPSVCVNDTVQARTPPTGNPRQPIMPADYVLPVFGGNLVATQASLVQLTLSAGVPEPKPTPAEGDPFAFFWPAQPPMLAYSWQGAYTAASSLVPSLFPISIFSKLASPTDDLTAQTEPTVILQGLTLYQDLLTTVEWPGAEPMGSVVTSPSVLVGITPAAICLSPDDSSATLVVTSFDDCTGNPVLADPTATLTALGRQFGRTFTAVQGCLPQGRYAMSLVYGTGQAWTVPNEAGVCQAGETANGSQSCTATGLPGANRPRLSSQDVVLTIGPPADAKFCTDHPTPAACCPPGGICQ